MTTFADEEIPLPPEPDTEGEEPEEDRAIDLGPLLADRLLDYARPIEVGATSGWYQLDEIINGGRGLLAGQLVLVAGRPGTGKALALDTPLATPTGWTTMGEVAAGDQLIGSDGTPTTVLGATEVMRDRPCYEVEFSDGSVIVADEKHQWSTYTRNDRRYPPGHRQPEVRTTADLRDTLRVGGREQRVNHSVRVCAPFDLPVVDLPIHPYVLGCWLGDGSSYDGQFTSYDPEILDRMRATGQQINVLKKPDFYGLPGLKVKLRALNVLRNKHIPMSYLRASEQQRRDLLAGLLDTDGTVDRRTGVITLALCHERLARDAFELVTSLGLRAGWNTKRVVGRSEATSTCYMINFVSPVPVFKLLRKRRLQHLDNRTGGDMRFVVDVRPVASVPVRCVEVDAPDHLYLVGRACIPTHNSMFAVEWLRRLAASGVVSMLHSLEMSRDEIGDRILSSAAGVRLQALTGHTLEDYERIRLAQHARTLADLPFRVSDSPTVGLGRLQRDLRAFRDSQEPGLAALVVDYIQLMDSADPRAPRREQVDALSRGLKVLAKTEQIPVIANAQLNRGPENRPDRRPQVSDLRESGSLEQDADIILLLHRPDSHPGELHVTVAKNRQGKSDTTVQLQWMPELSRINNLDWRQM